MEVCNQNLSHPLMSYSKIPFGGKEAHIFRGNKVILGIWGLSIYFIKGIWGLYGL